MSLSRTCLHFTEQSSTLSSGCCPVRLPRDPGDVCIVDKDAIRPQYFWLALSAKSSHHSMHSHCTMWTRQQIQKSKMACYSSVSLSVPCLWITQNQKAVEALHTMETRELHGYGHVPPSPSVPTKFVSIPNRPHWHSSPSLTAHTNCPLIPIRPAHTRPSPMTMTIPHILHKKQCTWWLLRIPASSTYQNVPSPLLAVVL